MIITNNIQAEQSIIGNLIGLDGDYDLTSHILSVDDFQAKRHQVIYQAVVDLASANKPYDLVMVSDLMTERGQVSEDCCPESYFATLMGVGTAMPRSLLAHAELVKSSSLRRRTINLLKQGIESLEVGNAKVDDVSNSLMSGISGLETGDAGKEVFSVDDLISDQIERITNARNGEQLFINTGFPELDAMMRLKAGNLAIIAARPSQGKAQPLDAKIRTTSGWSRMGDLQIGDKLASIDGKPSKVTGIFDKGERQVYRVTFDDGRSTEACLEHLWQVMYRDWDKPRVVNTARLMEMLTRVRYKNRVWIEPCAVESDGAVSLPIHPYLMGIILGDGGISQKTVTITNSSDFIIDKCKGLLPDGDMLSEAREGTWRFKTKKNSNQSPDVKKHLHSYGLLGCLSVEKFIPRDYLDASLSSRLELIRGLIDTDGYVGKDGVVQYNTSSKRLSDDFTELVRSVGGVCKVSSKIPTYDYKGENLEGARHYTHQIYHSDLYSLITLPRKKERLSNRKSERVNRLTLKSVEPTRTTQTRCISVSHDSHLYITDDYVVTHNTLLAVNMQTHLAKFREGVSVFFSVEMEEGDVWDRLTAAETGIPINAITDFTMNEDQMASHQRFISDSKNLRFKIVRKTGVTVSQIRTHLNKLKREHGKIGSIGVDYLGIMGGIDGDDAVKKIGVVARTLKELGSEFDCPVFLLSQLNRSVEKRPNRRPVLSDLRDSGNIEEVADIVLMLYRDDYYKQKDGNSDLDGMADILIEKNRNGKTGAVRLVFEGHMGRFSNHIPHYQEDSIPNYGGR